jgi:16S rRNA (cytosine1402-N4)-methyltransferase
MKMPITRTTDLITIISQTLRKSYGNLYDREFDRKVHDTAARIFQAIRIVVNDELNNIKEALVQAMELLEPKGRLAVISFHSLEDRIVKRYFISMVDQNRAIFIEKNPIRASWTEQKQNSRSKSAKLRIIEKI